MRTGTRVVEKQAPATISNGATEFFSGVGTAIQNNAIGVWDMATGIGGWILKMPVDPSGAYDDAGKTLSNVFAGLGYALSHPAEIIRQVKEYADKNPHNRGEVFAEALLIILPLPTKFLKLAKLEDLIILAKAGKLGELAELVKAGKYGNEVADLIKIAGGEEKLLNLIGRYGDDLIKLPGKYGDVTLFGLKISENKINYLLFQDTGKAKGFSMLGYNTANSKALENLLKTQIKNSGELEKEVTEYGVKYSTKSVVTGLTGSKGKLTSVWIVENGSEEARLVTAFAEPFK